VPILPYDDRAAQWHAEERARLYQKTPPFIDGQIAAVAVVNELTLITNNLLDERDASALWPDFLEGRLSTETAELAWTGADGCAAHRSEVLPRPGWTLYMMRIMSAREERNLGPASSDSSGAAEAELTYSANFGEPIGTVQYVLRQRAISRQSKSGLTELLYSDVSSVSLETFASMGECRLRSRAGQTLAVMKNEMDDSAAYKVFVIELHRRLAASGSLIAYTRGSWFVVAVALGIALFLAFAAFGMEHILEVPARFAGKLLIAKGLAGIALVAGPLYALASRPRTYDPESIPAGAFR
jgi:hypothetical protein